MSEDKSFDLGERISVVPNTLPHPQGDIDPWATAESAATPFGAKATDAPPKTAGPGLPVGYDPTASASEEPEKKAKKPKTPPRGKRPVPEVTRISRKGTALLTKFRETFGLQRIKVIEGVLTRKNPENLDENVDLRFGLRGLNYEDYQWVLEKAATMQQSPLLVPFAWKIAVCAIGVASFEGSPIWEMLGFEPDDPDHVRDPMYPHIGLRFQAADAFCDELTNSLFDTVEGLYALYEAKVDSQYMPKREDPEEEDADEEEEEAPLAQSESNS